MEMGSNDIRGEPPENTGDEGHEKAEDDTELHIKTAHGCNTEGGGVRPEPVVLKQVSICKASPADEEKVQLHHVKSI